MFFPIVMPFTSNELHSIKVISGLPWQLFSEAYSWCKVDIFSKIIILFGVT